MLFSIICLIAIGLFLLVVEVLFIPGTTVVGILGVIFTIVGIALTFTSYGRAAGMYTLLGTGSATLIFLYLSFRAGVWNKFSLKSSNDGKVNEGQNAGLSAGTEGITLSSLRPMGKAEFENKIFEVTTVGDYLAPGTKVKIIRVNASQIIVEPTN